MKLHLTMAGWAMFGASLMVGAVAVNSGLGLLTGMLGALLGTLHVSAILSKRMIAGIGVRREVPQRCRQNEPVSFGYKLKPLRGGGSCLALHVTERNQGTLKIPPTACGHVSATDGFVVRSKTVPLHRGHVALYGVQIGTSFPFGLLWARRTFEQPTTLIVWPARGTLRRGLLGRGDAHSSSITPSTRSGGADEFFGLREYRPGDSTRWIHWRRSAGRRMPVVREMSRPRPRTLWVVLDTLLDDATGRTWAARERAIRLTATIIEDALAAGYRVGAAWAHSDRCEVINPAERRGQLHRLLDALSAVDGNRSRLLSETAGMLSPRWLHQADVMLVSPASVPESDLLAGECLSRLRRDSRNLTILTGTHVSEAFQDVALPDEAMRPPAGAKKTAPPAETTEPARGAALAPEGR